ncbi:hypothetical protein BDW22DRAFT_179203 [Trametopsis cervina]|nr:hypothetical protein BDW22DRAFT_179203 [Trametopsis cervina]
MIYDGPRDSFVQNAKLALKLADTDIQFWADVSSAPSPSPTTARRSSPPTKQPSIIWGRTRQGQAPAQSSSDATAPPSPQRPNVTIAEAPDLPQKPERRSHVAAAGSAARLFLRRSLHGFKRHECVACQKVVLDANTVRAPCGHFYDISCILSLVRASTQDESLFPPRCCQEPLPTPLFEAHMDTALAQLFELKTREFATPKRVYCAKVSCSRFLGPRSKSKSGALHTYDCPAPGCATRTCTRCRCEVKKHVLHACRPDDVPRRLLQRGLAQQCPGCDRLVELQSGCFHITCACKTQFCYRCGSKWKTCKCPLWEDARMLTEGLGLGLDGSGPSEPVLPPVLPPVPRPERFRQTWLYAPLPPAPTEQESELLPKRRVRGSAPAQLEGRIYARESVVLRGIHAQERRVKHKQDQPVTSHPTIDPRQLDALEAHIDRITREVQHHQCRHDWRASLRSTSGSSCVCGNSAIYRCSRCAAVACMKCRTNYHT